MTQVSDTARAEMKQLHAEGMSVVKIVKALGYSDYTVRCVLDPEFKEKRRIQVETARKFRTLVKHVTAPATKPEIERGPIVLTERYAIRPYIVAVPDHSSPFPYQHVSLARLSIQGRAA